MPHFGVKKQVDKFTYRDVLVKVFEAMMGATHCEVEHLPDAVACKICGKTIRPVPMLIVYCNEHQVQVFYRTPLSTVRREMRKYIDEQIGQAGDRKKDPPEEIEITDDEGASDAGDPLVDPPKDGAPDLSELAKGAGQNVTEELVEKIKKLGWVSKARDIMREEFGDRRR